MPLESERNFAIMRGGDFHGVEKLDAVCFSSVRFMVTRDTVGPSKKENISCRDKKMEGTNGPDPLMVESLLPHTRGSQGNSHISALLTPLVVH